MKKFISILLLILVTTVAAPVAAQGFLNSTEVAYRDELARIKSLPGAQQITSYVQQTEEWLNQAASAAAAGERETAQQLFKQVRFSLELLNVMAGTEELRVVTQEQETFVKELPKKIEALKKEIEDLKKEKLRIEQEIAQVSK